MKGNVSRRVMWLMEFHSLERAFGECVI